jgi:hypothetical protein
VTISAQDLRHCSLEGLERIYREAPMGPVPSNLFRGQVLHRIGTAFAHSRTGSAVALPFERLRFGIDFARRAWFFLHPRLQAGHFRLEAGRSRWRDTQTLQLHYDVSRLPFRGVLYDEVKPLSESLALGLGGLNRDVGTGDLFFFLLEAA